jgi:3-oxoacyl-[acyl-carrier protein] reductase
VSRRVAFVTGASRGIGKQTALHLARAGFDVAVTARTVHEGEGVDDSDDRARGVPGSLDTTAALIDEAGARSLAVPMDLLDRSSLGAAVQRTLDEWGRIDVLVNNAARGMKFVNPRFMTDPQPFWESDPDAWRMVIETNIVGVFLMSRAVVPHMLAAGCGSIINVTINHETMVRRGFSPYGPSKAALEAMTTVWASELEGSGVHMNLLLPGGATATGMIADTLPAGIQLLEPEIIVPPALHLALAQSSGERITATEWTEPA